MVNLLLSINLYCFDLMLLTYKNFASIWLDSIVNLTKPLPEPLAHLRFLLCLIKSLSISSVLLPKISTEFGEDIEGAAISTPIKF